MDRPEPSTSSAGGGGGLLFRHGGGRGRRDSPPEKPEEDDKDKKQKTLPSTGRKTDDDDQHTIVTQEEENGDDEDPVPPRPRGHREEESRRHRSRPKPANDVLHSEEVEEEEEGRVMGWVKLDELPKGPRVVKYHSISSNHTVRQDSLSKLKIRVRLLQYPHTNEKGTTAPAANNDMLGVLEDRVFSWQEKVFSKNEARRYRDEKNLVTDRQKAWHRELLSSSSKGQIGIHLHSYVDGESIQERRSKVVAKLPLIQRKGGESSDEWEDVQEEDNYETTTTAPPPNGPATVTATKAGDASTAVERGESNQQKDTPSVTTTNLDEVIRREDEVSTIALLEKATRVRKPKVALSDHLLYTSNRGRRLHLSSPASTTRRAEDKGKENVSPGGLAPHHRTRSAATGDKVRVRSDAEPNPNEPPASEKMLIVASIPQLKKDVVVCRMRAYPSNNVLNIKAPFGFRVIHANRSHTCRLSWELYEPPYMAKKKSGGLNPTRLVPSLTPTLSNINFNTQPMNELGVWLFGEIVSSHGFDADPLCIHFFFDTPPGWRIGSGLRSGTTQSSYSDLDGGCHFSHQLSTQLVFSMDDAKYNGRPGPPLLLMMAMSIQDSGRVRYEGYGYISVPTTPGPHLIRVRTWKPSARSVVERMEDAFLDITPSFQSEDVKASVYAEPLSRKEGPFVANKLGLQTQSSGEISVRLHVVHQTSPSSSPFGFGDTGSKLDLLEKMSSATILKSVQTVIDSFNRVRHKAKLLTTNQI